MANTHAHMQNKQTQLEAAVDVHHSVIVSQKGRMEKKGEREREAQRVSTAKITALSHQISADDVCVCVSVCVLYACTQVREEVLCLAPPKDILRK